MCHFSNSVGKFLSLDEEPLDIYRYHFHPACSADDGGGGGGGVQLSVPLKRAEFIMITFTCRLLLGHFPEDCRRCHTYKR